MYDMHIGPINNLRITEKLERKFPRPALAKTTERLAGLSADIDLGDSGWETSFSFRAKGAGIRSDKSDG